MRICVIKPPAVVNAVALGPMPSPPLGLAYVAAALRAEGHHLQAIDSVAEAPDGLTPYLGEFMLHGLGKEEVTAKVLPGTEVIALGLMFTNNWVHDRELIAALRERFPKAFIMAGGEHATSAPEYCLRQASGLDAVVLGEGEETAVELIGTLSRGEALHAVSGVAYRDHDGSVKVNPRRGRIKEVMNIVWPAWDLFPVEAYVKHNFSYGVRRGPTLPVMASRGCPYDCTFCSSPQMWGRRYDIRSPKDMADEMEHLHRTYGITNFDFFDLTAIIYKEWIIEMAQEIVARGLSITWQIPAGTRAEAIDREVAEWLYRSGCRNITYAPETGSPRMLKLVRKKVRIDKMIESIRHSHKAGLNIKLNMIIGLPDETHRDVWLTIWFLIRCSWHGANDALPSIFSPYPGSVLFDRMVKEGHLTTETDDYINEIIKSDSLWPGKTYNASMRPLLVKLYAHLAFYLFYLTNFIFRPQRLFVSLRNVWTGRYESRAENVLGHYLSRQKPGRDTLTESRVQDMSVA